MQLPGQRGRPVAGTPVCRRRLQGRVRVSGLFPWRAHDDRVYSRVFAGVSCRAVPGFDGGFVVKETLALHLAGMSGVGSYTGGLDLAHSYGRACEDA